VSDELDVLLADGVIDEVLGRLKSGKEANISLVRRGEMVFAAKVYKDRATRSFKNNSEYKEGRKVRNSRTQRAIDGGGRFGRDAAEQAWKSAEADALYRLVGSGVRVPAPIMFYEGVLLMDLVRDADGRPAPRLIDVAIERDAAISIYADLVAQMISMLCCDLIHGDLSPYNILAAADGPTIIDFPQVISAVHSSRAEYFFLRDFDNIVRFLAGFDPRLAVHTADGRAIWRAYVSRELTPQFVPPPPPPPRATRGPDRRSRFDGPGPDRGRRDQQPQRWGGPPRQEANGRPQQRSQSGPPQQRSQSGPPQQRSQSGPPQQRSQSGPPQQQHPSRPPQQQQRSWPQPPPQERPQQNRGRRRRPKRRW
jgi:RIO kinase 1